MEPTQAMPQPLGHEPTSSHRIGLALATIDADRRSAKALLNTLMARPVEAPLGPPTAIEPHEVDVRLGELERLVVSRRPEVAAAKSAIRARESELDAARANSRWPSFMVGLSYMYMPMEDERNNYGVMLSMSHWPGDGPFTSWSR